MKLLTIAKAMVDEPVFSLLWSLRSLHFIAKHLTALNTVFFDDFSRFPAYMGERGYWSKKQNKSKIAPKAASSQERKNRCMFEGETSHNFAPKQPLRSRLKNRSISL